ncbi:hypothetical protein IK110_01295 [Candidatus Saccharibacteria bacterium]|nr:hypothetical protein [Candidatus Saccharibacteria bacterium]
MVFDFVMDLGLVDPKEPMYGRQINEYAFFLGIDDLYSFPNKRKKLEMVKLSTANRRLLPLVLGMFNCIAYPSADYSRNSCAADNMIREIYGIGTRQIDLAKAAKNHCRCLGRAQRMINIRMEKLSRSKRCVPWNHMFVVALYLPTSEYRKFCAALREKDEELKKYKDLKPIYKCLNAE